MRLRNRKSKIDVVLYSLKSMFSKPATIDLRNSVEISVLRGYPVVNPDKCTGCSLCERSCPSNAIEMKVVGKRVVGGREVDKKIPIFDYYKCIYCGLCAEVCPFKAIEMVKGTPLDAIKFSHLVPALSIILDIRLKAVIAYFIILATLFLIYGISRFFSFKARHSQVAYEPFVGGGYYNGRWEKYYIPGLLKFIFLFMLIEIAVFASLIYETREILALFILVLLIMIVLELREMRQ